MPQAKLDGTISAEQSLNYEEKLQEIIQLVSELSAKLELQILSEQNPSVRLILRATLTSSSDPQVASTYKINQLINPSTLFLDPSQSLRLLIRLYTDLNSHYLQLQSLQNQGLLDGIMELYIKLISELENLVENSSKNNIFPEPEEEIRMQREISITFIRES